MELVGSFDCITLGSIGHTCLY